MLTNTDEQSFFPAGWVLKLFCPGKTPPFQFVRLLERERPILFPFQFPVGSTVGPGAISSVFTKGFRPQKTNALWQVFTGIRPGVDLFLQQPANVTTLSLETDPAIFEFRSATPAFTDEVNPSESDFTLRRLGFINADLSPWEDPEWFFMVTRNEQVAFTFRNALDKTIRPEVRFTIAQYLFEQVPEADLPEQMRQRATPITLGAFKR